MPAAFTPGNIVVYRVGDGVQTLAGTGNTVFLDEYTTAGSLVQSIKMNDTGSQALVAGGLSTAEGFMQLSGDGKYLSVPGYNRDLTLSTITLSSSAPATVNRAVGVVDSTGVVINYSSLNDVTGALRSAVTNNGSDVYLSSSSNGVRYAKFGDATTTQVSSTVTNVRNIQIFGGQLYNTDASGAVVRPIGKVGTGVPTTSGQTITNLTSDPVNSGNSAYGMFFADLDATIPGIDTAYYCDDGSSTLTFGFTNGSFKYTGLVKLTYNGTTWTQTGDAINLPTPGGLRGLTGSVSGNTVTLFETSSSNIYKFVDDGGYNKSLSASSSTTFATVVTAGAKTAFRGISFAPNNVQPNVASITSTASNPTSASTVSFTVAFTTLVNTLSTSNLTLTTTGDVTGTIGTPSTSDGGNTWTVVVSGITGDGTMRLDVANTAGLSPTPGAVPFTTGTVVNVDHASAASDVLDVLPGNIAVFYGKIGAGQNSTLSLSAGNYTITDSASTIALTAAAITAGWTGNGTNSVTGPDTNTDGIKVKLAGGVDTFTLNSSVNDALTVTGGGDVGDTASFPVNVTYAGAVSVTGFDSLSVGGGVTLSIDSLTLGATAIGSSGTPISTKSLSVTTIGGTGGTYIQEADGASFTFTEVGGDVSIGNSTGTLTVGGASTWDTGSVTLTSVDGVAVNANMGGLTSTGSLNILANTDGSGSQGYIQDTASKIQVTASGTIAITVNTTGGGTGDAVLGQGRTDSTGFTTIDANAGSILWNPSFVIPTLNVANTQTFVSGAFTLKTSGGSSSIGTSASPLQLNANKINGLTDAVAGTGGVYITRWGTGFAPFQATATGAGNIQIWAGNGSNTSIEVFGSGLHTDSGSIDVRSWKYIRVNAPVGGFNPATSNMFSGTVLMHANVSGLDSQWLEMSVGNPIVTTNSSGSAVTLRASGQTVAPAFGVGGIRLGDVSVGSGGTVVVDAAYLLTAGSDSIRAGSITQLTGTSVDAPNGTVTLNAKDDHIGTSASPVKVNAAVVSATTNSTNTMIATDPTITVSGPLQDDGDIWLTLTSASTQVSAVTTTKASVDTATVTRVGDISITSTTGSLTINAKTKTDTGTIDLTSATSIGLAADLGDGTTGAITLVASGPVTQTAGIVNTTGALNLNFSSQTATFGSTGNKALSLVVPSTVTVLVNGSFDSSVPVQVSGVLGGSGSVGTTTVLAGGKVAPGNSPGKLSTGNIVFNSSSTFAIELNGNVAGTTYDQLAVNGDVDLGGATLTGSLGFVPGSGQIFRIVDNQGSNPVTGTFSGYAEGATVTIGATNFTITYVGGTGNDVELKAPGIATPPPTVVGTPVISDGSGLPVVQRSMVKQIIVTFSEAVNFSGSVASAFTVHRTGNSTLNGNPIGDAMLIASPATGPASTVTITFNAADTTFVENGSLIDGLYNFTIDATKVSGAGGALDGDNNTVAGGNYAITGTIGNKWFRLYADENGDGTVNQTDYNGFRLAFLAGPSLVFDFEGNGNVTQSDYNAFRLRFLGAP